jgi:ABC-type transporter Mla MlaB component
LKFVKELDIKPLSMIDTLLLTDLTENKTEVNSHNGLTLTFSQFTDNNLKGVHICIEGKFTYKSLFFLKEKFDRELYYLDVFYITLKNIERLDSTATDYLVDLIQTYRKKTIVIEGFLSREERGMFYNSNQVVSFQDQNTDL